MECDLLTLEQGMVSALYQVCFEFNGANRERECGGLAEAMKRHNLTVGTIITLNQEEEIVIPEGCIHVIPVWRWLLRA